MEILEFGNKEKDKIILIHGFETPYQIWEKYIEHYKNNYHIIVPILQGHNPRRLAVHLRKRFGVSQFNAERLMITELARVQTEAQKQSFERNGFDEYIFLALGTACPICKKLNEKHFKVTKMMPGTNAPPLHPFVDARFLLMMIEKTMRNSWIILVRVAQPMNGAD